MYNHTIHFMEASIVDLRYKMKEVLEALDRHEEVRVLYHGKLKGILKPYGQMLKKGVVHHPFFGMACDASISVETQMEQLRGNRYRAL